MWLRLLRVKHYIKNGLVFVPIFFNGSIWQCHSFLHVLFGMALFCMAASALYIVNDINDCEKDRLHPIKRLRPIASGEINPKHAMAVAILLALATGMGCWWLVDTGMWSACLYLALYFLLNIAYSHGLKDIPLVEIAILASGFVLRILFGGAVAGVEVSDWLYLTIFSVSVYMGLGKRRKEAISIKPEDARKVLEFYNKSFLDKNMYMFLALSIAFYSLWAMGHVCEQMIWSVPLVMLMSMRYSLVLEMGREGDPIDMILKDKPLIVLGAVYAVLVSSVLYY